MLTSLRAAGLLLLAGAVACTPPTLAQDVVSIAAGSAPRGVAIDSASRRALVSNAAEGRVTLLDIVEERVVGSVDNVPSAAGIAFNRITGRAVAANQSNNSITVFSPSTGTIHQVIPVGSVPTAVAVNSTTNTAVVANVGGNSITVVNLETLSTAEITGIPAPTGIQAVDIDLDLNLAAVTSAPANSLFLVDLGTRQIIAQVPVEQSPSGVAIDRATKIAVVANENSNSVSLVDLRTARLITNVPNIPRPQAVAINPSSRSALITTGGNGTLEVVNLGAAAVEASIEGLPSGAGVAFDPTTGRVVASLPNHNSVAIVRNLRLFTVVNGASFQGGSQAPASIVSGFGANLALSTAQAGSIPLPLELADTSVLIAGGAAPLFFVSASQINFQVPDLPPGNFRIEVFRAGQRIATGVLPVSIVGPGLFTINAQGTGQAAALNEDNIPNGIFVETTPDHHPAARGTVVQLFGTGPGETRPNPSAGSAATGPAPTANPVEVTIGGVPATVLYSGAAPGLVGVWQINVRVPANATPGDAVPVVVTIGGRTTNTVTIAIE